MSDGKSSLSFKMPYLKAPEVSVSDWLQGGSVKLSDLRGKYVLLHFFQQNCPGCFLSSLPITEYIHKKYGGDKLEVIGISSRFEEYEVNTKKNTEDFLKSGKLTDHVIESIKGYGQEEKFLKKDGRYSIEITHRIGWDDGPSKAPSKTLSDYREDRFVTPYECLIDDKGRIILSDPHLSADVTFHHLISKITGIEVDFA